MGNWETVTITNPTHIFSITADLAKLDRVVLLYGVPQRTVFII